MKVSPSQQPSRSLSQLPTKHRRNLRQPVLSQRVPQSHEHEPGASPWRQQSWQRKYRTRQFRLWETSGWRRHFLWVAVRSMSSVTSFRHRSCGPRSIAACQPPKQAARICSRVCYAIQVLSQLILRQQWGWLDKTCTGSAWPMTSTWRSKVWIRLSKRSDLHSSLKMKEGGSSKIAPFHPTWSRLGPLMQWM